MAAPAQASATDTSFDDLDFGSLESAPAEPVQASATDTSLDDLDFGSMESAPAEPAGETPDWLSSMAVPAQASATDTSLDDLDFGSMESAPAEPAIAPIDDGPDWLSAFTSDSEPLAETQSSARHAMPEHFPEVDLSKLPEDAAEDSSSTDYAFSFNRVAQHADLVNTNADTESFSFQRKPAWMRKGKSSKRK
jgi:hypothetical protein